MWTTPTLHEVKMDAEIGSYQEDTDPVRESPLVESVKPSVPRVDDGLVRRGAQATNRRTASKPKSTQSFGELPL